MTNLTTKGVLLGAAFLAVLLAIVLSAAGTYCPAHNPEPFNADEIADTLNGQHKPHASYVKPSPCRYDD
jgi:hypothetical protein